MYLDVFNSKLHQVLEFIYFNPFKVGNLKIQYKNMSK